VIWSSAGKLSFRWQRDSGPLRFATAHSLSTLISSGGLDHSFFSLSTSSSVLLSTVTSNHFTHCSNFNIMLNLSTQVSLRPFRPLHSKTPILSRPCKKRLRLYIFPFNLRFRRLTGPQSARFRIMRKSHVQRLHQLKQCAKLMEQSRNMFQELDQMQSTFINLAQQVHHIRATVDFDSEIAGPPFDGYTYIWKWKSIIIRFCGSNFYYRVIFDFTRYISPAVSEYIHVVY